MTNTVDKKEIEQFSSFSNKWWDKSGPFSALHKMSDARIQFIRQNAIRIFDTHKKGFGFLNGIDCLDIGCGGGILSEKLRRLGANVTGIDASKSAIDVAKEHAKKSRLEIDYKCITTSELLKLREGKDLNKFDLVIASEVIEHVNDRRIFLSDISKLCCSGGLVIFTTINKSFLGILLGKFFAENVLKVVPKGTHDTQKFLTPETLSKEAEQHNIILDNFVGFAPTFGLKDVINKQFGNFTLTSNLAVNYGAAGIKI